MMIFSILLSFVIYFMYILPFFLFCLAWVALMSNIGSSSENEPDMLTAQLTDKPAAMSLAAPGGAYYSCPLWWSTRARNQCGLALVTYTRKPAFSVHTTLHISNISCAHTLTHHHQQQHQQLLAYCKTKVFLNATHLYSNHKKNIMNSACHITRGKNREGKEKVLGHVLHGNTFIPRC